MCVNVHYFINANSLGQVQILDKVQELNKLIPSNNNKNKQYQTLQLQTFDLKKPILTVKFDQRVHTEHVFLVLFLDGQVSTYRLLT